MLSLFSFRPQSTCRISKCGVGSWGDNNQDARIHPVPDVTSGGSMVVIVEDMA